MTDKKVLIYTRVSTADTAQAASPLRQLELCRQTAVARGWTVTRVEQDVGTSAWRRGTKRPAWDAAMGAVRRREVDVLMAYSLSRLGRRTRDLLDLTETLRAHSVDLVVVDMA